MHSGHRSEQLAAGCRDAAEDCRGFGRATGSFPGRAEQVSELYCANCWKRNAIARVSSCRKSSWRCSRRPGRHGVRKTNPLPAKTTMTSMAMREPGPKPNETPSQKRGGRQPLARHLKRETNRSRSGRGGEALCRLRQGPAADCRRDQRTLRIHPGVDEGDSGRLSEVRLRLHGEDRHQASRNRSRRARPAQAYWRK